MQTSKGPSFKITASSQQRPSIQYNNCFQYQNRAQTVSGAQRARKIDPYMSPNSQPGGRQCVGSNLDTHQVLKFANQTEGMDLRNDNKQAKEKLKFRGKKEHVKDILLNKVPTLQNLQEQMVKHKDKLAPFYRKDNIKKLTEQQLMAGQTVDINSIDMEQRENFLPDKTNSNFKDLMARKMVEQLKPPTEEELIKMNEPKPDAILTDAVIDEDENNVALGQLKRQFEDNEADIIHDLYTTHFRPKKEVEADRLKRAQGSAKKQTVGNPMPDPSIYSKQLNTEVKYVQYIPKEARGTIEEAINKIYIEGDYMTSRNNNNEEVASSGQQSPAKSVAGKTFNSSTINQERAVKSANKCSKQHRHAKSCARTKETDIAQLQSQAFKYLILQKPDYEQIPGHENQESVRASFYPQARLPAELLDKIEQNLKFQRQMYIPDKILRSRPMTTPNSRSRFHRPNTAGTTVGTAPALTMEQKRHTEILHQDQEPIEVEHQHYIAGPTSDVYTVEKTSALEAISATEQSQNDQLFSQELVDISHLQDIDASPQKMQPATVAQNSIQSQGEGTQQRISMGYTHSLNTDSIMKEGEPRMVVVFSQKDKIVKPRARGVRHPQQQQNQAMQMQPHEQAPLGLQVKGQLIGAKRSSKSGIAIRGRRTVPNQLDLLLSAGLREDPYKDFPEARPGANNYALMNIPKSTWVSPFAHKQACSRTKAKNLGLNSCGNLERSFNVTHCLSLNSSLRPHKLFKNRNKAYLAAQSLPYE